MIGVQAPWPQAAASHDAVAAAPPFGSGATTPGRRRGAEDWGPSGHAENMV